MKIPSIIRNIGFIRRNLEKRIRIREGNALALLFREKLLECPDKIPVILISYNNARYLEFSIQQYQKFNLKPIVIDNASSDLVTRELLAKFDSDKSAIVVRSNHNFGHMVGFSTPVYDELPIYFAYSDPDLLFNPELPPDFMQVLSKLTDHFQVFKAGFALGIDGIGKLKENRTWKKVKSPIPFEKNYSIKEWESRFWAIRVQHPELEIYAAPIDTTFAVYNKSNFCFDYMSAVRVAGKFTSVHLPWFEDLDIMTDDDLARYKIQNKSSSWV